MQYRQYDNLTEVTLNRVKKKSFLRPASSKDTNLRNIAPEALEVPKVAISAQSSSSVPENPVAGGADSLFRSNSQGPPKPRGRLRSISDTLRSSLKPERPHMKAIFDTMKEDPENSPNSLQIDNRSNASALSLPDGDSGSEHSGKDDGHTSISLVVPSSDTASIRSLSDSSSIEPHDGGIDDDSKSINSIEDVARDKIVLQKGDYSKTMTLQKKKLRPRASTVTEKSDAKPEEEIMVRCILPGGNQTAVKASPSTTMEQILRMVCEKKALNFEEHTLQIPDSQDAFDLDRPLSYYKMEMPLVAVMPSKEKSYSTMCVSEGDRDVMILTYVSGKLEVMAATEEKLIERVTDEQEADRKFMDSLLLTFRSFISPRDFFQNLVSRFNSEPPENPTEDELRYYNKWIDPVRNKVLIVLTEWVQQHYHDFVMEKDLKQELEDFISQALIIAQKTNDIETTCLKLKELIQIQSTRYDGIMREMKIQSQPTVPSKEDSPLINYKAKQVAEQLCLLNHELFSNIDGIEFLNQIWKSGTRDELECPNLLYFIDRFNKESAWVATEICLTADFNKRVTVLRRLIETTKESLDKNNLFSVFSFLAGLNLTPVQKLKKTWAALPASVRKQHEELERLSDPSRNMKAYRDHLTHCQPPILPFLPIFLKDLIFYNDGNPSRVNNLVNFDKLRMMYNSIYDVRALAAIPYPFEPINEIKSYISNPHTETLEVLLHHIAAEGLE